MILAAAKGGARASALALGLAACAGGATGPAGGLAGEWGGVGVALVVSGAGGSLEMDCAHGALDPFTPRDGRFETTGTFTPEGGPEPEGGRETFSAVYEGSAFGDRLRLTIRVADRAEPIGPFVLERGREPLLRKCL